MRYDVEEQLTQLRRQLADFVIENETSGNDPHRSARMKVTVAKLMDLQNQSPQTQQVQQEQLPPIPQDQQQQQQNSRETPSNFTIKGIILKWFGFWHYHPKRD